MRVLNGSVPFAKFPVGTAVLAKHPSLGAFIGTVLASAVSGDEVEYELSNAPQIIPGIPLLMWESELEIVA